MTHKQPYHIIVIVLAFFSFMLAARLSDTTFERLPHLEDELAYLFQARIFAEGAVVAPIPDHASAYWQPFVINYRDRENEIESRVGKYAPGWPRLLAFGLTTGQPWVINAFFGMLTVAAVYRLGRDIFSPDVGLIAAALAAFSPMALLLNATLMAHTASLFCFTLFMWAYWRMTHGRHAIRWGIVAGLALGTMAAIRPLSAVASVFPFMLWSVARLLAVLVNKRDQFWRTFIPLTVLGINALIIAVNVPIFNTLVTGDPTHNLYLDVWEYDRLGFGEGYGRNGHTIIKGVSHARYDLSLTAADLFGWIADGWQPGDITSDGELQPIYADHFTRQADYLPGVLGLSLFVVIAGIFVGARRIWWQIYCLVVVIWFGHPLLTDADFLINDADHIWFWLGGGAALIFLPGIILAFNNDDKKQNQTAWTWLLVGVAAALIFTHMAYWVGSQRYSTRYYFEALTAFCLLGALALSWIIARLRQFGGTIGVGSAYAVFGVVLIWSLLNYSLPRIGALYQFNRVTADVIDKVEARRVDDQPILVIANLVPEARNTWRGTGSLMGMTDPKFESDLIVAWNYNGSDQLRQSLIAQHPGRQVIDITYNFESSWFTDCAPTATTIQDVPEACILNPEPEQ